MKKMIMTLLVLLNFTPAVAAESYFMANGVRILATKNAGQGMYELRLTYQQPCWAKYIDNIQKPVIIGNPLNPASGYETAIGILLSGDKMNPCSTTTNKKVKIFVNTSAAEGQFLGFKLINN